MALSSTILMNLFQTITNDISTAGVTLQDLQNVQYGDQVVTDLIDASIAQGAQFRETDFPAVRTGIVQMLNSLALVMQNQRNLGDAGMSFVTMAQATIIPTDQSIQ